MFKNISDNKVEFYCDNRFAAIEDLDFVLSEIKAIYEMEAGPAFERLSDLIREFDNNA